jgi:hypothetical protein
VIAAVLSVGAGLDAAANRPTPDVNKRPAPAVVAVAGHRPSPNINRRPKPSAVVMPCPAADDVPQCNLRSTAASPATDGSVTALRSQAAGGGGVVSVSVGRITPSPR